MKVELRLHDASASVEGSVEEVKDILSTYWPSLSSASEDIRKKTGLAKTPKRSTPSNAPKSASASKTKEASMDAMDAEAVANRMKSDPSFLTIKAKIIDVSGRWLDKAKLVAYLVDGKITSGDVRRVFDELKVKTDLPTISKALSNNSTQFITSGSSPKYYEMTLATKEAFEAWLMSDGGE